MGLRADRRQTSLAAATLDKMPEPSVRPHVVIIGGLLFEPRAYRTMRERLLGSGAARVTIAPIHLPDWAAMGLAGMGPLLLRGARTIREVRRAAPDPVIVIGHSIGGVIARLAMSPEALDGRCAAVADDVGCLITLGSPHRFEPAIPWRHPGVRATEHLARVTPGAFFAPETGYLTVGSTLARPEEWASTRSAIQALYRVMGPFVGATPGISGDGLVGTDFCQLQGAIHIEYPDVTHGFFDHPWYGDAEIVDRWWPAAVEQWQDALAARAAARH